MNKDDIIQSIIYKDKVPSNPFNIFDRPHAKVLQVKKDKVICKMIKGVNIDSPNIYREFSIPNFLFDKWFKIGFWADGNIIEYSKEDAYNRYKNNNLIKNEANTLNYDQQKTR
jgi:hypothetical protein